MTQAVEASEQEKAPGRLGQHVGETVTGDHRDDGLAERIRDVSSESGRTQGGAADAGDDQRRGRFVVLAEIFIGRQEEFQRITARRGDDQDRTFARQPEGQSLGLFGRYDADVVEDRVEDGVASLKVN